MTTVKPICSVDGCSKEIRAKGYCQLHYDRLHYHGEIGSVLPMQKKPRGIKCSVDDCYKVSRGDGMCITHYQRKRKTGVIGSAELQRRAAGEGHITVDGYKKIKINGKHVFEHRHVMEKVLGRTLRKGENVHHKNGLRLDNSPDNLELWLTLQPSGQRVEDLISHAIKLLNQYPEVSAQKGYLLIRQDKNVLTLSEAICGLAGLAA